jgi:hypothetical protein
MLNKDSQTQYHRSYLRLTLSFIVLAIICKMLVDYPLHPLVLAVFLACYGYCLYRLPDSWLFAIPALLPVMDFTPWTGRFFFDEFDLVILTTVAVRLWHKPQQQTQPLFSQLTFVLLGLFGLFYAISLLRGLLPLQTIDANAFTNYYSYYNSLRVGKGMVWALLLLPALKQALHHNSHARIYLAYGMLAGLTGVIIIAIVERSLFVGLFDFSSHYRINALFSTMHTGGGHIESYLMLSLPFIAVLFFKPSATLVNRFCGISLFISGLYVLLVTFSRGGYIGFVAGFIVFIASLAYRFKTTLAFNWKPLAGVVSLALIIPVIAIPVFKGQLIQQRFSIFSEDKAIRTNHWLDAKAMMDDNLATQLLGMGVGSYPRTYFWLNTEGVKPATYKVETEVDNNYLRLRGGDTLFIGQYVSVKPHSSYHLQMDIRSTFENSALSVSFCEKSLIYSLRCSDVSIPIKSTTNPNAWKHIDTIIDTAEVGSKSVDIAAGLLSRPVQLSLSNGNGIGKVIDIDNIKLVDTQSNNKLVNGDFSKGTDRWYFAAEKHHPWHILNLWVHVFFDQGLVGLILFVLLIVTSCYNAIKKLPSDPFSTIFLTSLSAFMVVGWVDSSFDAPRITLLFFLIVACCLANVADLPNLSSKNANSI